MGEHPPLQGRADAARLRHRPVGDADHAGDRGRLRRPRSGSATELFEEGVFATSVVFPTVALDQARLRTIVTAAHAGRRSWTRASRRSPASAASWGSSPGDGRPRDRARDEDPQATRPAARRPPPHRPVAGQRRPDRRLRGRWPWRAGSPSSRSPTTSTSTGATPPTTTSPSPSGSGPFATRRSAGRIAGCTIRFGVGAHLRPALGGEIREPTSAATATTSRSARSTTGRTRRTSPSRVRAWVAGPPTRRGRRAVLRPDRGRRPVRPVRHPRPSRRRQALPAPARDAGGPGAARRSCSSRSSGRSRTSGTALEVNTSGLRHRVAETYPAAGRSWRASGSSAAAGSLPAPMRIAADWFAWGLEAGYASSPRRGSRRWRSAAAPAASRSRSPIGSARRAPTGGPPNSGVADRCDSWTTRRSNGS